MGAGLGPAFAGRQTEQLEGRKRQIAPVYRLRTSISWMAQVRGLQLQCLQRFEIFLRVFAEP